MKVKLGRGIFLGGQIVELDLSSKRSDTWETVGVVNKAEIPRIRNENWGAIEGWTPWVTKVIGVDPI